MNIAKLNPWNWFKKEEQQEKSIPVQNAPKDQALSSRERFHTEMDRLLDNISRGFPVWESLRGILPSSAKDRSMDALLKPRLDVSGSNNEYLISVELPGVSEKDFSLELQDDSLIIRGEKRQEHEDKGQGYYRMERSYGFFQRVLSLPEDSATADIKAAFKNGVLAITIPRQKQAAPSAKQIEISTE